MQIFKVSLNSEDVNLKPAPFNKFKLLIVMADSSIIKNFDNFIDMTRIISGVLSHIGVTVHKAVEKVYTIFSKGSC